MSRGHQNTSLRPLSGESGWSLVELMVATGLMLAVLAIVVPFLTATMRSQPEVSGRAENVQEARVVLERLTREIRQGLAIDQATPSRLSLRTYSRSATCGGSGSLPSTSPSQLCQVTYECTTAACTRTEAAPGVFTGTAVAFATGIANANVFSYSPAADPVNVDIRFALPNPDSGSTVLQDGASLRNATFDP